MFDRNRFTLSIHNETIKKKRRGWGENKGRGGGGCVQLEKGLSGRRIC